MSWNPRLCGFDRLPRKLKRRLLRWRDWCVRLDMAGYMPWPPKDSDLNKIWMQWFRESLRAAYKKGNR